MFTILCSPKILVIKTVVLVGILLPFYSFSQKKSNSIEIVPVIRYDNYADFEDRFGDRSYTTRLKLKGISWGVDARYKLVVNDKWDANAGIGYYKYTFSHIRKYSSLFRTTRTGRELNIVRQRYPLYATNKYWYNSFNLSFGVNRKIPLQSKFEGILGVQVNNFISYSQRYNVPGDGSIEKKSKLHYYAFSGLVSAGINKKFNSFYVGPQLVLPVFDKWSDDHTLSLVPGNERRKWLNGVGLSFVIGFYLNK